VSRDINAMSMLIADTLHLRLSPPMISILHSIRPHRQIYKSNDDVKMENDLIGLGLRGKARVTSQFD
jgi:hypothetical protein